MFSRPLPLDRRREKALRQGDIALDGQLDLHGLTQDAAYTALAAFMRRQVREGARYLLVITGKGREGEGVLRRSFKDWLADLPERGSILAVRPAAPKHGGEGAFYVLLRRQREE